jgi:hypothetical protein
MHRHPPCHRPWGLGLVLGLAALFLTAPGPAGAALTHRYSFNDGTARDSAGGADGVPVNGAAITNGQVNFANSGSFGDPLRGQYVDLPNQIARTPALTLETWVTDRGSGTFAEIASLGAGTAGERQPGAANPAGGFIGTEYVALIPNLQSGLTGTIRNVAVIEQSLVAPPPLPLNAEHYVAYTVDFPNGAATLYLDGVEVGRRTITIDPSRFDQVNDWLARSQWSPDAFFNGSINEFRIYDSALSAADVAGSYARGPDAAVPEPSTLCACALAGSLLFLRRR